MQRVTEPELMEGEAQALAYAQADFEQAHNEIFAHLHRVFPRLDRFTHAIDLGCGPGDMFLRMLSAFESGHIDAVDGSAAMLKYAEKAITKSKASERVRIVQSTLPSPDLAAHKYDLLVSNSLLHHLHDPTVLWETIKCVGKAGGHVFIGDLMRPTDKDELQQLVMLYAADAPEVLRKDFKNSLHAAFTLGEIRAQLRAAGLALLQCEAIDDRHLIVFGRLQ